MKNIAFLVSLLFCVSALAVDPPTVGQYEIRKRGTTGYVSYGVDLTDGQVLGQLDGAPAAITPSIGATLGANTFTDSQTLPLGSASAPSLNFSAANTGIFSASPAGQTIDLSINGNRYWTFSEASSGGGVLNFAGQSRIGFSSTGTVVGVRTGSGQTLMFGTGGGAPYTLAGDAASSGTANAAGGSITLEGGRSNGTGAGGDIVLSTPGSGSTSGTTQNTTAMQLARWSAKPVILTEGTATGVVRISYNGSVSVAPGGAVIHWTVGARLSGAYQSVSGLSIVNFASGVTPTITTTSNTAAVNSGTLTCTATVVAITSSIIELRLNATSSLAQDFLQAQASVVSAHNVGSGALMVIQPQ